MTAQAGERLLYKGEEIGMAAEPLNQHLIKNNIEFYSIATNCWRGYYGQWEIVNNKLFLVGLRAYVKANKEQAPYIKNFREVGINFLFPGQSKVFANWFTGKIRIPKGKLLDYIHMGYASLYEKDLFLVFENGVLIKEYLVDNKKEYKKRLAERRKERFKSIISKVINLKFTKR